MKYQSLAACAIGVCLLASCNTKPTQTAEVQETATALQPLVLPTIPDILTTQEAQDEYLATHYWDKFNFADTAYIGNVDITEQALADFTGVLHRINPTTAAEAITNMMAAAHIDSLMFDYFINLTDKYYYNPNSPLRNDEYYMPVLNYLVAITPDTDAQRYRYMDRLQMAMKNRPGEQATNVEWVTADGQKMSLKDVKAHFTLLFFNEPDCHDCARVKEYMNQSQLFSFLLSNKTEDGGVPLQVVGIYAGEDEELWKGGVYPSFMINGYDKSQKISMQRLYDLKAYPTLYLLDDQKRVVLKDVSVEQVERWLHSQLDNREQ